MTDETPDKIEPIRRAFRNSARTLVTAARIEPIDAALGSIYATHDLAMQAGMDAHAAIEWIRTAADLMERQVLKTDAERQAN